MKVYIARIYCPYEGTTYAYGIFSTREKAEQTAPWFTENAEHWRKHHNRSFEVVEYEIDTNNEFENLLQGSLGYLKYVAEETGDGFVDDDCRVATVEIYNKLKHLYRQEEQE